MPGSLVIDERLLTEALKLGGRRSRGATVNAALQEYVQRRRRLELVKLFGKVDFHPDWDYKKDRRAR